VQHVLHLGFEVRVEVKPEDGEDTWVQTTRDRARELELEEGQRIWLRPAQDPVLEPEAAA
jgi:sulfate/thiosulfate transport system ATP-binding protein